MSDDWCEEHWRNCHFYSLTGQSRTRYPFIQKIHSYDMEKGFLEYTGHYYLIEEDLPERYLFKFYGTKYTIEIYRREQIQDLSKHNIEIEDGLMACLTPTHRERIWFRVLSPIENSEQTTTTQTPHTC